MSPVTDLEVMLGWFYPTAVRIADEAGFLCPQTAVDDLLASLPKDPVEPRKLAEEAVANFDSVFYQRFLDENSHGGTS